MYLQTENTMVENSAENASCVNVLLLSERINSEHPFWIAIERAGHNVSQQIMPEIDENNSLILIDDMAEIISSQWIDFILKNKDKLKSIPRVLLKSEGEMNADFKSSIYQTDAWIDIQSDDKTALDKAASEIARLSSAVNPPSDIIGDWQKSANLSMKKQRKEYSHNNLISDIAALGPLIREYEFAIKSLLKLLAKSFEIPVTSIYIYADKTCYTYVHMPITTDHLSEHLKAFRKKCEDAIAFDGYTDVVWGRRLVKPEGDDSIGIDFTTGTLHLDAKKKQTLGYVLIPASKGSQPESSSMNLLLLQISLLVNSALLFKTQRLIVQDNIIRLGTISETCKLFSDVDKKNFALQFLLILLEHLSATKGILGFLDDEGRFSEVYSVGFEERIQTWLASREALPWVDVYESDVPLSNRMEVPVGGVGQTEELHYIGYPLADFQGKIGVLFIFFKQPPLDAESFLPFFVTMSTLAGTHFTNIKLHEEFVEKRIMEEQINIMRNIQRGLLPQAMPSSNNFEIAAKSRSAKQVGGDFYDFIELSHNYLAVVIGDVSGKGIPASLLMVMTKSLLKFHLQQDVSLCEAVTDVNRFLAYETPAEKFVTAQAIYINAKNKSIELANAGHGYLVIYRSDTGIFEQLDAEGLALGILPEFGYEIINTTYSSGDIILMFTDGLSEAMSPTNEQFGYNRIEEIVRRMTDASPDEITNELFLAMEDHAEGKPQHDDTTVIVLKAI